MGGLTPEAILNLDERMRKNAEKRCSLSSRGSVT